MRKSPGSALVFFFLVPLELILSAIYLLIITRNPATGWWLDSQLFAAGLAAAAALVFLYLGLLVRKNSEWSETLDEFLARRSYSPFISVVPFLIGLGVLVLDAGYLGRWAGYFEPLRYLLFILGLLPIQWVLLRFGARWFDGFRQPPGLLRSTSLVVLSIGLLLIFINITGLGISPDPRYWNVAGIPITMRQLLLISLLVTLLVGAGCHFGRRGRISPLAVDILVAVSLYLIALFLWQRAPMAKHFFSLRPAWPEFQPFPFSDARAFDLGAISILKGWGIYFGQGTQSPLYSIFLAGIRVIAGGNYFLSGDLQIAFLALMSPVMYLFGRKFHSRIFGLASALILMIRQSNAIVLSTMVASANVRILTTEVPTLFGLILVSWATFEWLKQPRAINSNIVLAGGVLGATCLFRLNPILLFPALLIVSLFVFRKQMRLGLSHALIFSLAFLLVLIPWFITGRDAQNRPYLLLKFYDIINTRYEFEKDPAKPQFESFPQPSAGLLQVRPFFLEGSSLLDVTEFPFFVFNHTLHNLIEAFLVLPDSFDMGGQHLENLALRPYWDEQQNAFWKGELAGGQIPIVIVNILMFSYGIAWSWKKWSWAGWVPLITALVYSLSLGFARTSGSRYLVPMDWVVPFYYGIALVSLLNLFANPLKPRNWKRKELASSRRVLPSMITASAFLLGLALLIFFAEGWVRPESELCNPQIRAAIEEQLDLVSIEDDWHYGEVLYPYREGKTLSFVLLACRNAVNIEIQDFAGEIEHGQRLVVLHDRLYALDGTMVNLIWPK